MLTLLGPLAIPTIICLAVGFVLLIIELFTPGFGVSGGAGLVCLIASIVMQFAWGKRRVSYYLLAIVLLLIILMLFWFIRSMQRGRLSKSFLVLDESISGNSTPDVASANEELIGKIGFAITPLRPAGIAEIDGKRLDVMTDGTFINQGSAVVVKRAEGMHILVSSADAPV